MIDKSLEPVPEIGSLPPEAGQGEGMSDGSIDMSMLLGPGNTPNMEEHDDGSATIHFTDSQSDEPRTKNFTDNLAEVMEDGDLQKVGSDLTSLYDTDLESRKGWEDAYKAGMDLLGIKVEDRTKPWPGACGVYHPVLMEAVVRFQAQAMMELFPPQGPAKTKIIGLETPETQAQADRVKNELNHILVEDMEDYRDETETLLFRLALAGSAFRKTYYDPISKIPCAKFVPAEDLVVNYGESNLRTASRITYVDKISSNEMKKRMASGFYRDVELDKPTLTSKDSISAKEDDITGMRASGDPDRYTVLEIHTYYDVDASDDSDDEEDEEHEVALPYIIHIEEASGKVLAIYRNWDQNDPQKAKKNYFTHYKYVPGMGFYGFGLIHIIGGLAKSGTGILRQLVDAGTLSNLPGGLKSRGLRIKGDDSPIRPGEFRDVDVMGGDIAKNITFLPYKEPSAVLYQLLGNIVDEARRVGSIADMNVGDMKQEAPVGTTLALMERAMKVMSAVQARCHASLQQELRLIANIVKNFMGPQYSYSQSGQFNRSQDFGSVDIVPVSDPGATTMSQRVVQYQAVIQLAAQNPQIYDMRKLNLDMLNVLGIKDAQSLIPDPSNIPMADPVSENMSILKGSPAKAYQTQDHESHIQVHMAFVNDPSIKQFVSQTPQAATAVQAMYAHIAEHMAYKYRNDIEKQMGTELPPLGQQLPPDVENHLSALVAQAAEQVLEQSKTKEQQAQNLQAQQDPMIQLQQRELDLKEMALKQKAGEASAKIQLAAHDADQKAALQASQIAAQYGANADRAKLDKARQDQEAFKQDKNLIHDQHNEAANRAVTLASKGMDIAGKIAIEKIKPKPSNSGGQ